MAVVLAIGNDSCFLIDGIPYQRGQVIPVFERDVNGNATGKVSFRDKADINAPIVNFALYSDYTDASTGNPFADLNALITWCASYAFVGIISGSGGSGITFSKVFYIVAAPAAPNEKAAGATFQDDWLTDASITCIIYNGAILQPPFNNFTSATGTLGLNEGNWIVNDVVTIFKA